jgi:lysophospholipase L1-like esterase
MVMKHLIFIGDSLTQWCDWDQRLPKYRVTNLGISGETVEGLLARRDRIRKQIATPDTIFLMTGINNIANEQYDFYAAYDEIVRNLTTWYRGANTVVVQSLLPVDLDWISSEVIKDANKRIEGIARDHQASYLDIHSLFIDGQGRTRQCLLTEDGVHIAKMGYDVWVAAVKACLKDQR